jgi:hypothetical protein
MKYNIVVSLRILIKIEFSKVLINSRVSYDQNKHNDESQRKCLSRELYEYHCLDLHKMLNSSRHRIHCFAK